MRIPVFENLLLRKGVYWQVTFLVHVTYLLRMWLSAPLYHRAVPTREFRLDRYLHFGAGLQSISLSYAELLLFEKRFVWKAGTEAKSLIKMILKHMKIDTWKKKKKYKKRFWVIWKKKLQKRGPASPALLCCRECVSKPWLNAHRRRKFLNVTWKQRPGRRAARARCAIMRVRATCTHVHSTVTGARKSGECAVALRAIMSHEPPLATVLRVTSNLVSLLVRPWFLKLHPHD